MIRTGFGVSLKKKKVKGVAGSLMIDYAVKNIYTKRRKKK